MTVPAEPSASNLYLRVNKPENMPYPEILASALAETIYSSKDWSADVSGSKKPGVVYRTRERGKPKKSVEFVDVGARQVVLALGQNTDDHDCPSGRDLPDTDDLSAASSPSTLAEDVSLSNSRSMSSLPPPGSSSSMPDVKITTGYICGSM